jgi:CheY-like chemotaxis protein
MESAVLNLCINVGEAIPKGAGVMLYGFARQSNGKVRMAGHPGGVTTIRVPLPRQGGAASGAAPAPDAAAKDLGEVRKVVLVVDDEAVLRMLTADVLQMLGCSVLEAGDGQVALRILQSDQPIDLMVTDIGLPGMNGRQLAQAARALRPLLKVLFVTGYDPESGAAGPERNAEVLRKPFALDTLACKVQEMLAA